MAAIRDDVFDSGLNLLNTSVDQLDITSTTGGDPGLTYATVTTNRLGTAVLTPALSTNSTSGTGRAARIPAVTTANGAVNNTGTAGWWAVISTTNSNVLASGALTTSQAVTSGNRFTLDLIEVAIRDAT